MTSTVAAEEAQSAQNHSAPIDDIPAGWGDDDEWEYEYSNTETETYYLAVDLSYPEMLEQITRIPHHSRGGYYKNWLDQPSEHPGLSKDEENEGQNDNDDEPLPEPEADDDDPDIDPRLLSSDKGKGVDRGPGPDKRGEQDGQHQDAEERQELEDIQILELHSKNPIISYKGRVFEGQWAEVIGTETIFANHETESPLPALRNLPGNVDMLAASATRILTKEKIVRPKVPDQDPLAAIKEEWNIRIPVGKDRTGERGLQTRFLENLMALKRKKGEKDQVTVYARDPENKDFKDHQDPDYKPRRRRRILNEDGEEIMPKRRARQGSSRVGRPRGRGRGRATAAATAAAVAASAAPWDLGPPLATGSLHGLSRPTPERWEDLGGDEDEDDEESGDEDDEISEDEGEGIMSQDEDDDDVQDEDATMMG